MRCRKERSKLSEDILLFPSIHQIRTELKSTLALAALGILLGFFLGELDLPTETIWAFKVSKYFLYMAPLRA